MISVTKVIVFLGVMLHHGNCGLFHDSRFQKSLKSTLASNDLASTPVEDGGGELDSLAKQIPGGGVPGKDYPILSSVSETDFSCDGQVPGYYGDTTPGIDCQVFHICQDSNRTDSFICPNGTIFNQQYLICDWWFNFDCSSTEQLVSLQADISKTDTPFTNESENGFQPKDDQLSDNNKPELDENLANHGNSGSFQSTNAAKFESKKSDSNGNGSNFDNSASTSENQSPVSGPSATKPPSNSNQGSVGSPLKKTEENRQKSFSRSSRRKTFRSRNRFSG